MRIITFIPLQTKVIASSIGFMFWVMNGATVLIAKEKKPIMIKHEVTINGNMDTAWKVLGPGYAEIQTWASSIKHSEALDNKSLNSSLCTIRQCSVNGLGTVQERLLEYSEQNHRIHYEVVDGMPGMVKFVAATWALTDEGQGKIKLVVTVELKTGGFFGGLMRGPIRKKIDKLYGKTAEEFKYFVESGTQLNNKAQAK